MLNKVMSYKSCLNLNNHRMIVDQTRDDWKGLYIAAVSIWLSYTNHKGQMLKMMLIMPRSLNLITN